MKRAGVLIFVITWMAFGVNWLPNGLMASLDNRELLSPSFGISGIVTTDIGGSDDEAHAVVLQPDGKIIVAGRGGRWGVARYNADGSLDTTFDGDGKLTLPLTGTISATGVFLQTDGKIIVTGTNDTGTGGSFYAVARLNPDGSLDTTFDTDGIASTSFGANYIHAGTAGILQPDGKIIVAGHLIDFNNPTNIEDWAAARFNADGSLDTTFDTDGKVLININYSDEAFGAALQTDGKIVIAGLSAPNGSSGNLTIARLNSNGSLDATFDGDGKVISPFASSFARAVAIQTDGKIIAAGSVFTGNADDFTAERYNADGSLDATFGTGGRVVTAISPQADRANDIELQSDGKFILSGYAVNGTQQFALARYNSNGSLDTTFSGDGIQTTQIRQSSEAFQSVVLPDGKILTVGISRPAAGSGNTNDFALVEYDADGGGVPTPTPAMTPTATPTPTPTMTPTPTPTPAGTLDTSFDGDGKATTNFNVDDGFGSNEFIYSVAVQTDGKIVAAGASQRNVNGELNKFALARYNADGSLDTTFDADGKLTTAVGVSNSEARAVAVQTDGKIVAAGNAAISANSAAFAVVRYNANGSLDSTFGTNGIVLTDITVNSFIEVVKAMRIQPDGKIVVAGQANGVAGAGTDFAVARYNTNGTLDTTFGSTGIILIDFSLGDSASALSLQADGKIVLAGRDGFNGAEFALARLNANGSLDTTFGTGGKVTRNLSSNTDEAFAVAIQPDGKIVTAGRVVTGSNQEDFAVIRFNANGTSDNSFNTNGSVTTSVGTVDAANALVLQPDGKIVAVGLATVSSVSKFAFVRYTANGALDSTFGTGGVVTAGLGDLNTGSAYAAVLQSDGKIVAAGNSFVSTNNNGNDFALVRFYAFAPRKAENDFDGDGKTDLSVFRPSNTTWYLNRSAQGLTATQFGLSSDKLTPADFDGDGKTDIAVWREDSFGYFYILNSSNNTFRFEQFGTTGDSPIVAGDWDGDGKADPAVYRAAQTAGGQSFFYYRPSAQTGVNFIQLQWGTSDDVARRGDFDGDGKMDAAVYRPSNNTWYIRQSSNGQLIAVQFGLPTDKAVSGDFDGDGKTDVAVFRPSNGFWYIRQSSDAQFRSVQYGLDTDAPVAGDYDGDGKTDVAVWRDGIFYILQSASGLSKAERFGAAGDVPTASAFVR